MAGTGKGATPRQRELAKRIKTLRTKLGLSQEALALKSGINRTYVGSLESGDRNPSLENLCRLSLALEVDVGKLIRGLQEFDGRT